MTKGADGCVQHLEIFSDAGCTELVYLQRVFNILFLLDVIETVGELTMRGQFLLMGDIESSARRVLSQRIAGKHVWGEYSRVQIKL